jgi:hypothetical protein
MIKEEPTVVQGHASYYPIVDTMVTEEGMSFSTTIRKKYNELWYDILIHKSFLYSDSKNKVTASITMTQIFYEEVYRTMLLFQMPGFPATPSKDQRDEVDRYIESDPTLKYFNTKITEKLEEHFQKDYDVIRVDMSDRFTRENHISTNPQLLIDILQKHTCSGCIVTDSIEIIVEFPLNSPIDNTVALIESNGKNYWIRYVEYLKWLKAAKGKAFKRSNNPSLDYISGLTVAGIGQIEKYSGILKL